MFNKVKIGTIRWEWSWPPYRLASDCGMDLPRHVLDRCGRSILRGSPHQEKTPDTIWLDPRAGMADGVWINCMSHCHSTGFFNWRFITPSAETSIWTESKATHYWTNRLSSDKKMCQAFYAAWLLFCIGIFLPKTSMVAFYFNIFPITMPYLRLAAWIVLGYLILSMLVTLILFLSWCRPISSYWLSHFLQIPTSLSYFLFIRDPQDFDCTTSFYHITYIVNWALSVSGDIIRKKLSHLVYWLQDH